MKTFAFFILMIFTIELNSQNKKKFFIDNENEYVILLDNDIQVSHKNVNGTEIDIFVKRKKNTFNYTLLISKIFEHNFIGGNLLDSKYESYFKESCKCEILNRERVNIGNLNVLRFKIEVDKGENKFLGFNDSFVKGDLLYNILFLTFEKDFVLENEKFLEIMKSMVVNGKTSIDGHYD